MKRTVVVFWEMMADVYNDDEQLSPEGILPSKVSLFLSLPIHYSFILVLVSLLSSPFRLRPPIIRRSRGSSCFQVSLSFSSVVGLVATDSLSRPIIIL